MRRLLRVACIAKIIMEIIRHNLLLILVDKISPIMHKTHSLIIRPTFASGNAITIGCSFISWVSNRTNGGAKWSEMAIIGMWTSA